MRRRTEAAEIETKIGNHAFRPTGITAYLKNGDTLEKAADMANYASTRTTQRECFQGELGSGSLICSKPGQFATWA